MWRKPIRQPALLQTIPCCHCQRKYQVGCGNSNVLIPGHQQPQGQVLERIQVTQCLFCWWSLRCSQKALDRDYHEDFEDLRVSLQAAFHGCPQQEVLHNSVWRQGSVSRLNSGFLLVSVCSVPGTCEALFRNYFRDFTIILVFLSHFTEDTTEIQVSQITCAMPKDTGKCPR